jgi:small conductance mechanosensitive channel
VARLDVGGPAFLNQKQRAEDDKGDLGMNAAQALTLVYEKLAAWVHAVVLLLPNLVAALFVVALFTLLSKLSGRLLRKVLKSVWRDKDAVTVLVSKTTSAAILLIGILIALSILDLDKPVTSLLAGVGVIGIALGFAFQDIASNFMSGILISMQQPCEVGDLIKTGNYTGKVERIALRSTTIRTFQGPLVIIPNKDILQSPLTNFTRSGQRRVEIKVGVAYDNDLEKVKRAAIDAVSSMDGRDEDRDVEVHFEEFDDTSINFSLWLWVKYVEERDYVAARSDAIMRIKKAFTENEIQIQVQSQTDRMVSVLWDKMNS